MIRKIYIYLLFCLLTQMALGQTGNKCSYKPPREGETWCFYSNVKLEFHGGNPGYSTLPSTLPYGKGCSSISDQDGNLVIYSDGKRLWDRNSSLLTSLLNGDLGSTQSSLIVPQPGGGKKYFIFTIDLLKPATKGLNFSSINLTTATTNDTLPERRLLNQTSEKLTGVKHANGRDYWVVAHDWGNNSFIAYKVTNAGVDSLPVISNVGMIHSGSSASRNSVGYMKLSPDGSKLALAIMGANMIEWFDFNTQTGHVSTARQIPSPDIWSPYGVEFSPDGSKLYFTTVNATTNSSNSLYQVDLAGGTAPVLLNRLAHDITALQIAVDGKVYCARYKNSYLSVIENPNRPDTACNLKEDGISLTGSLKMNGLPNLIQSFFDIPAITFDTKCEGDDTYFYLTNPVNIDSIRWDFGDPASGSGNSGGNIQPFHVFSASGSYFIKAKEWFQGRSFETSVNVTIKILPPKSFEPDSLYILSNSAIMLDAGPNMETYLWQDGSSAQKLEVSEPAYYNVTITDSNCCQQSDTIHIILLDLLVPNAFSPNNDLLNDRFHVIGPSSGIDNYHFIIFSRWGQLVWETRSVDDRWDGTLQGKACPTGVYSWVMSCGVTGSLHESDKIEKRGVLTLVR
jgi:gliding motility-associated-like protein